MKVIMTGTASDAMEWQPHIRNKERRETLADRFKDPDDPFRIVIVRDMWLTGFDAPSLHTIYIDKPMKGHGLMQAIARVNRVFEGQDRRAGGRLPRHRQQPQGGAARLHARRPGGKAPIENEDEDVEFSLDQLVGAMLRTWSYCREAFEGFDYTWPSTARRRSGCRPSPRPRNS